MSRDTESGGSQAEQTFSVVTVPEHLTQQVLEYVQSLIDEEDETSGYMIGGLGTTGLGSGVLAEKTSHSNCVWKTTATGSLASDGWDVYCSD